MTSCSHDKLILEPSGHSQEVGYRKPTARQISSAIQLRKEPKDSYDNSLESKGSDEPGLFPAALVLPDDELAYEPDSEGQSVQEWHDMPSRNAVTSSRRTIYVAASPSIAAEVAGAKDWSSPKLKSGRAAGSKSKAKSPNPLDIAHPKVESVIDYLKAFYHPLAVKLFSSPAWQFIPWDDKPPKGAKAKYVALSSGTAATRIRVRQSPDGVFSGQLNLNDLIDVAMEVLPKDAYALLMLIDQDMYEDDEDDFCCGRAYGGSRVAVISSARYNPDLDAQAGIDREHAWPASHCQTFVDDLIGAQPKKKRARTTKKTDTSTAALYSAVQASLSVPLPTSPAALSALWLGRLCKTVSHELGHCFGIAHCSYFACIMQGTASIIEDSRQPPYLCPVDRAKVLRATGGNSRQRYAALEEFCERLAEVDAMFAAFAAWLRHHRGSET